MTITVSGPNGVTVDFPDGTDSATIDNVMRQNFHPAEAPSASRGILGKADDIVRMIANGATFGFADELAAGGNSLLGHGDYASNVAQERARDAQIMQDAPVTSNVAKIAGAIASPITKVVGAGSAALKLPRYADYALQGAALGGLAGAGESKEGSRLGGATVGGALGAATGVAVPAIMDIAGGIARGIANKFSAPATAAARQVERALARNGQTVDQAETILSDLGPESTVADLGGNVRGLAEAAATVPGKALTAVEQLRARQFGQGDRLQQAALDAAGVAHVDELIAKRSVAARPLYEAAFAPQTGPITTKSAQITSPTIERLLERPDIQRGVQAGIKDVMDEAAITGEPVNLVDYALRRSPETGQFERVGTPNLRLLDAAKRGLDQILQSGELKDQFGRPTQRWYRLDGMRQTLVNQMDDLSPKDPETGKSIYKMAREAWAGPSDVIEGLSHINKVVDNARDGSDITGRLFGSKSAREKLTKLFGNPDALANFAKTVANEKTFAETNRAISGNSRTAYRGAAQNDMANDTLTPIFNIAENPSLGNMIAQGFHAAKSWVNAPPAAIADELAPLYSSDPAMKKALLDAVRKRVDGGTLLDMALYGDKPKSLLLGSSRVGGYSGGLLGADR